MSRRFVRFSTNAMLLVGVVITLTACDKSPTNVIVPATLPSQITECETNTQRVCGTWSLTQGTRTYTASWPQGSQATISVVQFDSVAVVFNRTDNAGPTPDMIARYVGIPAGASVKTGIVQWTTGGLTFSGKWDASW